MKAWAEKDLRVVIVKEFLECLNHEHRSWAEGRVAWIL